MAGEAFKGLCQSVDWINDLQVRSDVLFLFKLKFVTHFNIISFFTVMVFVAGKRYNFADVTAALCMSLGLVWFTLADSKVAPNFNITGSVQIIYV